MAWFLNGMWATKMDLAFSIKSNDDTFQITIEVNGSSVEMRLLCH